MQPQRRGCSESPRQACGFTPDACAKLKRSRPGEPGARRILAVPLVAVEAVIRGIDVDLGVNVITKKTSLILQGLQSPYRPLSVSDAKAIC